MTRTHARSLKEEAKVNADLIAEIERLLAPEQEVQKAPARPRKRKPTKKAA